MIHLHLTYRELVFPGNKDFCLYDAERANDGFGNINKKIVKVIIWSVHREQVISVSLLEQLAVLERSKL